MTDRTGSTFRRLPPPSRTEPRSRLRPVAGLLLLAACAGTSTQQPDAATPREGDGTPASVDPAVTIHFASADGDERTLFLASGEVGPSADDGRFVVTSAAAPRVLARSMAAGELEAPALGGEPWSEQVVLTLRADGERHHLQLADTFALDRDVDPDLRAALASDLARAPDEVEPLRRVLSGEELTPERLADRLLLEVLPRIDALVVVRLEPAAERAPESGANAVLRAFFSRPRQRTTVEEVFFGALRPGDRFLLDHDAGDLPPADRDEARRLLLPLVGLRPPRAGRDLPEARLSTGRVVWVGEFEGDGLRIHGPRDARRGVARGNGPDTWADLAPLPAARVLARLETLVEHALPAAVVDGPWGASLLASALPEDFGPASVPHRSITSVAPDAIASLRALREDGSWDALPARGLVSFPRLRLVTRGGVVERRLPSAEADWRAWRDRLGTAVCDLLRAAADPGAR